MNFKTWCLKQISDLSPVGIVLGTFLTITGAACVAILIVIAFVYPQLLIGYSAAIFGWVYIQYRRDTKNDL
jgi:hypothetical protein